MNGFVTLAHGAEYLERAAAFAVSAGRFSYPTVLMYSNCDPSPYRSLFFAAQDVSELPVTNDRERGRRAIWELKKYAYQASDAFSVAAFCDADSLVIRDPGAVFQLDGAVTSVGGREVISDEMKWTVPPWTTTNAVAKALGVPTPIQTLNGGFFAWRRGPEAKRWFDLLSGFFARVVAVYDAGEGGEVGDELCLAFAFAAMGIRLDKIDASIGVWDAIDLELDVKRQVFSCRKPGLWDGHLFSPYIAHFGGSRVSKIYRSCAHDVLAGSGISLPLFAGAGGDDPAPIAGPREVVVRRHAHGVRGAVRNRP